MILLCSIKSVEIFVVLQNFSIVSVQMMHLLVLALPLSEPKSSLLDEFLEWKTNLNVWLATIAFRLKDFESGFQEKASEEIPHIAHLTVEKFENRNETHTAETLALPGTSNTGGKSVVDTGSMVPMNITIIKHPTKG
eukprot:NODE_14_length_42432_cov_0.433799.p20 type:complete len:137 gc:universal NODE_14_length_42432_cov_0.433799:40136-40546(+)